MRVISYRNFGRISTAAAAAVALLLAQFGVGQGLPGTPVCEGNPPTPRHNCRVNGECSPHNACQGAALGAIYESSRTWCCKVVRRNNRNYCQQYTAYWRCCQRSGEPAGWFGVCVLDSERLEASCDGQYCN